MRCLKHCFKVLIMSTVEVSKTNARDRLRELRKHTLRLSLDKFSRKLGLSLGYIHSIEAGKRNISNSFVSKLKSEFDVNPAWLLHGEGHPLKQGCGENLNNVGKMSTMPERAGPRELLPVSEVEKGRVPDREDFYAYIDTVLDSAEQDQAKWVWCYLELRRILPRFNDSWSQDYGRYLSMVRAASELAQNTFPEDELERKKYFDELVLVATAKASIGSDIPEVREMARNYLQGLVKEGEIEDGAAQPSQN